MTSQLLASRSPDRLRPMVLTAVALLVAAVGLTWAKWVPYSERAVGIANSGRYPGKSLLTAGAGESPLARAWDFTWTYTQAIWPALLVALVISACVDVLVPREWMLRVLKRRTSLGGSVAGGLAAMPGMMCTCCAAPLVVTLRRIGVPTSAALAFWLANPVLNPAVLVFLGLLVPWPWLAVRVLGGVILVFGVTAFLGHVVARRAGGPRVELPVAADRAVSQALGSSSLKQPRPVTALPRRLLRSFSRLALVLVPEYVAVVFLVGLVGPPLSQAIGASGALAVLIAAAVGAFLVLPTAGEIPIVLALAAAGASAGVLGALLVALPALSFPSAVMVGRAVGWRVTAAVCLSTVAVAVGAGGLLTVLV